MTDRDVEQCARVLEEFFASQCVGHADCKLPHEELDYVINLARERASPVARPVTREALRKALGYPGPIPDDAVFWTTNQLYAALVRLGVAQQEPPR